MSKDDPNLLDWLRTDDRFFTDHDKCFTRDGQKVTNNTFNWYQTLTKANADSFLGLFHSSRREYHAGMFMSRAYGKRFLRLFF